MIIRHTLGSLSACGRGVAVGLTFLAGVLVPRLAVGADPTSAAAAGGPTNFEWSWTASSAADSAGTGSLAQTGADVGSYETVVRENLQLRREQERLLKQIHELKQTNAGLQLQVREGEEKRANLAATLREIPTAEETAAELNRLRQSNRDLEAQVTELNRQLRQGGANVPATPAPAPQPGSDLFKRLEKDNLELRGEIAELKNQQARAAQTQQKLAQQGTEHADAVTRLQAEKLELQAQVAELRTQLAEKQAKLVKLAAIAKSYQDASQRRQDTSPAPAGEETAAGFWKRPTGAAVTAEKAQKADDAAKPAAEATPAMAGEAEETTTTSGTESPAAEDIDPQANLGRALRFERQGRTISAERLYQQALKEDPADARPHFYLGRLYEAGAGQAEKAAEHYRRYLELDPDGAYSETAQSRLDSLQEEQE
jgi:hypothetical protein